MTLVKWTPKRHLTTHPFGAFGSDFDRLFDDFFTLAPVALRRAGALDGETGFLPRVDVRDAGDAYVVSAAVPGFAKEQLSVEVHGDHLTLGGTVAREEKTEEGDYYRREMRTESFRRVIDLPGEVLAEGHDARLKDGVLTVTLKKRTEQAPKAIQVEIGGE